MLYKIKGLLRGLKGYWLTHKVKEEREKVFMMLNM